MSKPESIKIDDVEYVRKDAQNKCEGDIKIVVADRGFVYIGRAEFREDIVILRNSKNLRLWGTTKGLGELVSGPTGNTVLDNVGTVRIPMRAVISVIDVEQVKWSFI
jgi:hypothetical protein